MAGHISDLQKFCLTPSPNHQYTPRPSRPTERGVGHRHERGTGCGGRGSVGRVSWSQGGLFVRERARAARDDRRQPGESRTAAYGKTVWSWHPLLVSSRRRSTGPTGSDHSFNPPVTEAKRNSSPGRARHKPSNHCAGNVGCSPLPCMLVCVSTTLCTRDRRCSAHPAFPAPSFFGANDF